MPASKIKGHHIIAYYSKYTSASLGIARVFPRFSFFAPAGNIDNNTNKKKLISPLLKS